MSLKSSRECQDSLQHRYEQYGEGNGCYKRQCSNCGKMFYARRPEAKYCSYRCCNDFHIGQRTARKYIQRLKTCLTCGKLFRGKKVDAKYCSAACKQVAYRKSKINQIK